MSINKYNNFTVEETKPFEYLHDRQQGGACSGYERRAAFMEGEMRDFAARTLAKWGA